MAQPPAPRPQQLIDQWGNPISSAQQARLRQHQALPRLSSPRNPFSTYHPTQGLNPAALAAILSQSALGQSQQYMELLEEIEEKDLHYGAILGTRKRQVAQLPIRVEAAEAEDGKGEAYAQHAAFLRSWLKSGVLQSALFHALDGISKGYSVLEIIWLSQPGRVLPMRLVYRPQRFFEVDWRDGETVMLRENSGFVPLAPHKFLVHRHPSKSGLLLRSGLGRVAVWAWMFKQFTMQDWAVFAHNYGQPIRVGRYGPESTNEDRAILWKAVSSVAGDMAAIFPKSMEVEFVEVGDVSKGSELYERRANFLNAEMSKLVLGQTGTTDANPGSHAAGRTHRLVQEDIERSDAGMLATTLNTQLIPQIIAFNFGPQAAYPYLEIGQQDETPLVEVISAAKELGPLGLKLRASEIHARLGTTPPDGTEEDVIGGRAPVAPPAGGGGLSGGGTPPRPPGAPGALKKLLALHSQQAAPELVDALAERLALDAAGALHGMTEEMRLELEAATDLDDLAQRMARLQLDPTGLGRVIGQNLALAHLVGQAVVVDDLREG